MFLKAILLIVFAITACGTIPSDPDKTLERATVSGLTVGYSVNPPWVLMKSDSVISGIEGELINNFGRDHGMKIIWENGSEQELSKNRKYGNIRDNLWSNFVRAPEVPVSA